MKKFFALFFAILLVLSFGGCESKSTISEKTQIKINLPKDNSVNGYRKNESGNITQIKSDSITLTENINSYSYCGNKNSKKFHKVGCSSLKKTKNENKVYYKTRDEFVSNGFEACKICNP